MIKNKIKNLGFTLIELLVVMSIVSLLATISLIAIQGVRESARNSRRKADLESIRQALEFYRSDCDQYPVTINFGGQLSGSGAGACASTNVYISEVPTDPNNPTSKYYYERTSNFTYFLCAALENEGEASDAPDCTGSKCGSGGDCTYEVTSHQ